MRMFPHDDVLNINVIHAINLAPNRGPLKTGNGLNPSQEMDNQSTQLVKNRLSQA